MMTVSEVHTLSGAYALDALTPEEAEWFEEHLADCASCRQEVRELQAAAGRMGEAEAIRPPAHLKARVLAAADRQPQLPPKVRPIGQAKTSRWSRRLLAAAAAVVVIVGGAIGYNQLRDQLDPEVSAVFSAADTHVTTLATPKGDIRVAVSEARGEMAIDTDELESLPSEQVYQLWTITGDRPTSAGLVEDLDDGAAMPLPGVGSDVAITIEPAGGSEQPTTKPIVVVDPGEV